MGQSINELKRISLDILLQRLHDEAIHADGCGNAECSQRVVGDEGDEWEERYRQEDDKWYDEYDRSFLDITPQDEIMNWKKKRIEKWKKNNIFNHCIE